MKYKTYTCLEIIQDDILPMSEKEKAEFKKFQKRDDALSKFLEGSLQGVDFSNWKEERMEYLLEKHK